MMVVHLIPLIDSLEDGGLKHVSKTLSDNF